MLRIMSAHNNIKAALMAALALLLTNCSGSREPPASQSVVGRLDSDNTEKILNVYNWADYIEPSIIPTFEQEYGIKVNYDVFNSSEVMETKLLTGHSNYDLVVSSDYFLGRQIKTGVYQKLDKSQLPNLRNVDAEVARDLALYDPGNQYAVDYNWLITTGLGYNVGKIKARMADAPVDSWRLIYDPAVVSKFKDCGVSVLDSPGDVIMTVLVFLGKDPNSESVEDLNAAEQALKAIRPYVRYLDSTRYIEDLANGETCLALGWSMDVTRSRDRAKQASNDQSIVFSIPLEGSVTIMDVFAIPVDAPGSASMMRESLRNDPGVYPPPEVRAKLVLGRAKSQEYMRRMTRAWTRFKTGT
jgi:putrescine transport system substrate-binding protein